MSDLFPVFPVYIYILDTIDWFKKIKDKKRSTFVQFDIIEFYPSITKELLVRSLNHAREYTEITEEEIEIILARRKTILSDNRRSWVKSHVDNFDVPMGAYNSAQVADLVGIYILDTLGRIVNSQQVGLYRDDGIIYIPDSNGPKTASIQKKIIRAFKLLGFRIQIASNLKIVDFLDVTLNLNNGTFKPFSKNDSAPRYVNISSNHPRSVLRQIPNAVNQRINRLSSGKKMFEENKSRYDDALKDSGFQGRLEYLTPVDLNSRARKNNSGGHTPLKVGETVNNSSHGNKRGKNRNRKVVWFNPPFCKLTNINIGRHFLHLLDKHFNRGNPLSRIFNRNTVKISHSCTKNMYNILSNHNRRLLNELTTRDRNPNGESCNCRNKEECPLGGRCTTRNVVYQACISPMEQQRDGERIYIGISAGNWKQRWYSHRHSFSNPKLRYQTALSKYFWGLKDQGLSPQIKWKILRHSSAANSFNGRCNLCLDEKISIINFKNRKLLLNKRNELVFKCRHRGKFKLS